MVRKRYENKKTLEAEAEFMKRLAAAWNCRIRKLPISYNVDALASRNGGACAWVEVKCRSHKFDEYPDVILSMLKWKAGVLWAKTSNAKFIFAVHVFPSNWGLIEAITVN